MNNPLGLPQTTKRIADRLKADVAGEAPDSNPFLKESYLQSLCIAIARRQYDSYLDLDRVQKRLFPDTADETTAPRWGGIFVGPQNAATNASGNIVITGSVGASVPIGKTYTGGGNEYTTTSNATINNQSIVITSLTRIGTTAIAITSSNHNLSSFVPVTVSGVDQTEYNQVDAQITVNGLDSFTYEITGTPASPATGSIIATYTTALIAIESVDFGSQTNLTLDTPLELEESLVGVDSTAHVDFGEIGGGSDAETLKDYIARYLDKIRNPVAHYNVNDIVAKAKTVTGVTRVFVEEANDKVGSISITTLERTGEIAKATTAGPHGLDSGMLATVTGANEPEYNINRARVLVTDTTTFYYAVIGSPSSPASGTISASLTIPLGISRTFFMRDNDAVTIPSASEVAIVKGAIDEIRPANTCIENNIVKAPDPVAVDFAFTDLVPNTSTMRAAVLENLKQFFEERTTVSVNVDEDAYRAAIISTIDPDTGNKVQTFTISAPAGDIAIGSGQIAILGTVTGIGF